MPLSSSLSHQINKVREVPNHPELLITHADTPELFLWNIDKQPNRQKDRVGLNVIEGCKTTGCPYVMRTQLVLVVGVVSAPHLRFRDVGRCSLTPKICYQGFFLYIEHTSEQVWFAPGVSGVSHCTSGDNLTPFLSYSAELSVYR